MPSGNPRRVDLWSLLDASWTAEEGGTEVGYRRMLDNCTAFFEATGASLFLLDEESGTYRLVAKSGSDAKAPEDARITAGQGIAGLAIERRRPLIVGSSSNAGLVLDRSTEIESAMVVPLVASEDGCVGVLNLSRKKGLAPFTQTDLRRAAAVARHLGLAVGNATLLRWVREQALETARLSRLAEIGQMTAAIAHEVRNPLTAIRSAAQLAQSSPEEAVMLNRMIEEEAVKLDALCTEFLEFARPVRIAEEPVDLADIARHVVQQHLSEFDERGVSLHLDLREPRSIRGDRRRIEQIVRNLILNALQACQAGDTVTLRVHGDRLTVEDTGAGMTADAKERLFTPFFTTKPSGTGLGLSNIAKIVEAHAGTIRVESEAGQGTTFEIIFGRAA